MPPAAIAALQYGRRQGLLWVAVSPLGRPVGFALMKLRGGTVWLDQLSVLDHWQRRGYGAALIERSARTAHAYGFDTLYLSTYRDVPWNGPYYERRGFQEVPRSAFCPAPARRIADRAQPRPFRLASRHHAAERLALAGLDNITVSTSGCSIFVYTTS